MKRCIVAVVAAVFLFTGAGHALASEGTEVAVGLKAWMNQLKEEPSGGTSETSNSILLVGPMVEVKTESGVFAELAYLTSMSNYKIGEPSVEFKRNDIDLAVGYMFTHNIGALVGYRNSVLEEKDGGVKTTVSGPLVGVVGNAPINDMFSIYGNLKYLMNKAKTEGSGVSVSEDATGYIVELGVAVAFNKQVSASVGYQVESTKGKDSSDKETFSGVTLAGKYAF